jgi:hypothetical protein
MYVKVKGGISRNSPPQTYALASGNKIKNPKHKNLRQTALRRPLEPQDSNLYSYVDENTNETLVLEFLQLSIPE